MFIYFDLDDSDVSGQLAAVGMQTHENIVSCCVTGNCDVCYFLKAFLSLVCVFAGKSLKTLMSKGILQVHPPICDCPGCRISSPVVGIFPPFCHTAAPVFLCGVNMSTGEATQIIFDLGTVCGF